MFCIFLRVFRSAFSLCEPRRAVYCPSGASLRCLFVHGTIYNHVLCTYAIQCCQFKSGSVKYLSQRIAIIQIFTIPCACVFTAYLFL